MALSLSNFLLNYVVRNQLAQTGLLLSCCPRWQRMLQNTRWTILIHITAFLIDSTEFSLKCADIILPCLCMRQFSFWFACDCDDVESSAIRCSGLGICHPLKLGVLNLGRWADPHASLLTHTWAPLWHFSYCFSHQPSHSSKHILAFASLSWAKWFFMICTERRIVFPLWIGWLIALLCRGSICYFCKCT